MTEKIVWNVYAGLLGAVSTLAAKTIITKLWEVSTGEEPPDPNDPDVPLTKALIWATASGIGVGVTQLVMNRYMTQRWTHKLGSKPNPRQTKLEF